MSLKNVHFLGLGVGLSLLYITQSAAAQTVVVVVAAPDFDPESQENRIGLEFDWLHTGSPVVFNDTINVLTWDVFAQIGITRRLFLDLNLGWAYADIPPNSDRGLFGNPVLGLHFADSASRVVSYFIGGSLAIPVNADLSNEGFNAASYVASIRAYAGLNRFIPSAFPLTFRGGIEIISAPLFVRIDLAPTFLIALNRVRTTVVLDQGNEIGLRARFGFLGGLRLQENFILTELPPGGDHAQLAMEPFLGYESDGPGVFARFGLLFALDGKLGFGFSRGKDAIMRFTIGGKF
jgi:hypothetical protein